MMLTTVMRMTAMPMAVVIVQLGITKVSRCIAAGGERGNLATTQRQSECHVQHKKKPYDSGRCRPAQSLVSTASIRAVGVRSSICNLHSDRQDVYLSIRPYTIDTSI